MVPDYFRLFRFSRVTGIVEEVVGRAQTRRCLTRLIIFAVIIHISGAKKPIVGSNAIAKLSSVLYVARSFLSL